MKQKHIICCCQKYIKGNWVPLPAISTSKIPLANAYLHYPLNNRTPWQVQFARVVDDVTGVWARYLDPNVRTKKFVDDNLKASVELSPSPNLLLPSKKLLENFHREMKRFLEKNLPTGEVRLTSLIGPEGHLKKICKNSEITQDSCLDYLQLFPRNASMDISAEDDFFIVRIKFNKSKTFVGPVFNI